MTRSLFVAVCLAGSLMMPSAAHSQTLLQWLFPRLSARRASMQTTNYQPWTTAYRGTSLYGASAYTPTTVNYGGNYGASSNLAYGGPQTGWYYRPQTQYRTVWSPVPTTTYQPVAGGAYAGTQPCTTQSWQARRVPYVTYRPFFAGVPKSIQHRNYSGA